MRPRHLFLLFTSLWVVLVLAVTLPSRAQNSVAFRLVSVKEVGSKRYQPPEIARAAGLKIGQSLTVDGLSEAAARLSNIGIFSEVGYRYETTGDAMTVQFTAKDAPGFLPCTFQNLIWFTPDELMKDLRAHVPLFDGSAPPSGQMLEMISAEIGAMLASRGLHASVTFSPQMIPGRPPSMQFREVGISIPVKSLEFTGTAKVDQALLQQASHRLLDQDFELAYVWSFMRGTVVNVYHERGYLRADFGEPVPHLLTGLATPNAVTVTIPVTEGEQYNLKELKWSGESDIPYPELAKSLHAQVGSPLNEVQLDQDVLGLILLFHPKGYLVADAKSNVALDDAARTAVCQIEVRQGDLYRLGKLEVTGLDDAHNRLFEQLSRLHPGDPYDMTYWNQFIQDVGKRLPPSPSGWKYSPDSTIHHDSKTVDVLITFKPGSALK